MNLPKNKRRFTKQFGIVTFVALLVVTLAAIGQRAFFFARTAPTQLLSQCHTLGLNVNLGPEQWTVWGRSYHRSRLSLVGVPEVLGTIETLTLESSLTGVVSARINGLQLTLKGEPYDLLPRLMPILSKPPLGLNVTNVDVHYEHVVLGKVTLKGVTLERVAPQLQLHVERVSIGSTSWDDVPFAVRQRGDIIETALGATSIESAKLRLSQLGKKQRGWTFTLHILHQPLNDLLHQLQWADDPSLAKTNIVGTVTLIVDPVAPKPYGSLQLTFDNWPKPAWPEADALLGQTGALLARIAPSVNPFEFELPNVEATLSLFSPVGSGKLVLFGPNAGFRFDLTAERNCAQLNAHLPPGRLQEQVATFVEQNPNLSTSDKRAKVQLRFQLDTAASPTGRHVLAAEQTEGCGLASQLAPGFTALNLPTFQPRIVPRHAHAEVSH